MGSVRKFMNGVRFVVNGSHADRYTLQNALSALDKLNFWEPGIAACRNGFHAARSRTRMYSAAAV